MIERCRWFLLSLGILWCGSGAAHGCAAASSGEPVTVPICVVVADPEKYDGKLIRVTGSVVSDGLEVTAVVDKSCGGKGMILTRESPPGALKKLDDAIFTGYPGTTDKYITVTLTGTFHLIPGEVPQRTLVASKVTNIRTTMKH